MFHSSMTSCGSGLPESRNLPPALSQNPSISNGCSNGRHPPTWPGSANRKDNGEKQNKRFAVNQNPTPLLARDFAILWYAYNSIHRCTNVMVHMPENSSWLCLNSLPQHEFPARFCTVFLHPLLRHRSILSRIRPFQRWLPDAWH